MARGGIRKGVHKTEMERAAPLQQRVGQRAEGIRGQGSRKGCDQRYRGAMKLIFILSI